MVAQGAMIERGSLSGATIGRLRIVSSGLDPLVARLRAEAALGASSLEPSQLPPAAILCVRALTDPLPGTLRLDEAQPFAAQPGGPAWQAAVTARLDALTASAARPLLGPVPVSAEAVLFADRAELLACLALDWLSGQLTRRWWWRHLLRRLDARAALLGAWRTSPEFVPPALAHLAARGDVVALAGRLSDPEAEELTAALLERHGLVALRRALAGPGAGPPPGPATQPATGRERSPPGPGRQPGDMPAPAPWRDLVPLTATALRPEAQLWLGVGLGLVHRPSAVRITAFAEQTQRWYRAQLHPTPVTGAGVSSHPFGRAASSTTAPTATGTGEAGAAPHPEPVPLDETPAPSEPRAAARAAPEGRRGPIEPEPSAPTPPVRDAVGDAVGDAVSEEPSGADQRADPRPPADDASRPTGASELGAEVKTDLGGVFFLVDAALRFELYGDFTAPLAPGLELPIWDFLALIGEQLLLAGGGGPAASQPWRQDPLWALLGQLSGRGDGPPGAGFAAPKEWRAPDEWPTVFGTEGCRWSAAGGRLRAWHPAGFWPFDVPAGDRPVPSPLGPLAQNGRRRGAAGRVPRPRRGRLERWVDWWAAYLRARLVDALGLHDAARPAEELADLLLRHRARVLVTAARLDIVFRIDEVFGSARSALPVRLAGLDRDPGWIPAAGRTIAFHFK